MREQHCVTNPAMALQWYHWLWIGIPLVLMLRPPVGGFIAVPATCINYRIMHSGGFNGLLTYISTGTVSIVALGIYMAVIAAGTP